MSDFDALPYIVDMLSKTDLTGNRIYAAFMCENSGKDKLSIICDSPESFPQESGKIDLELITPGTFYNQLVKLKKEGYSTKEFRVVNPNIFNFHNKKEVARPDAKNYLERMLKTNGLDIKVKDFAGVIDDA